MKQCKGPVLPNEGEPVLLLYPKNPRNDLWNNMWLFDNSQKSVNGSNKPGSNQLYTKGAKTGDEAYLELAIIGLIAAGLALALMGRRRMNS